MCPEAGQAEQSVGLMGLKKTSNVARNSRLQGCSIYSDILSLIVGLEQGFHELHAVMASSIRTEQHGDGLSSRGLSQHDGSNSDSLRHRA